MRSDAGATMVAGEQESAGGAPVAPPAPPKRRTAPKRKPSRGSSDGNGQPQPWHVVLLDDDTHTYDYVIAMMQKLFAHPLEHAFKIAQTVDADGRAICLTCHKERAEFKRDQILAFGADPLMSNSTGSMRAVIEPADSADDSDGSGSE